MPPSSPFSEDSSLVLFAINCRINITAAVELPPVIAVGLCAILTTLKKLHYPSLFSPNNNHHFESKVSKPNGLPPSRMYLTLRL